MTQHNRILCLWTVLWIAFVTVIGATQTLAIEAPEAVVDPNTVEPTGELTRDEALTLVMARNPDLRVYSLDIRIADAQKLQASMLPNPDLEIEFENIGGTGDIRRFHGAETTVAISQPIETAGKRAKRLAVASADRKVAETDYRLQRAEVLSQADKAFHELLAAQRTLGLAAKQVDIARKLAETVDRRVTAGRDPAVEGARAAIELADAQLQWVDAGVDVELARRKLSLLWGAAEPRFTHVVAEDVNPIDPPTLEVLREQALEHPSVIRWAEAVTAARARLTLARARSTPDVSVMGGYRRLDADSDNAFVFGLALPLPVFDRNQAGRLEAAQALARVREQAAAARSEILSRLGSAHAHLTAASYRIRVLRESILPDADAAFNAALTGYEQGKFDYINILDAQRTLVDVHRKAIAAALEYHRDRADLEAIIDRRLSAVGPTAPAVSSNASSEADSNE